MAPVSGEVKQRAGDRIARLAGHGLDLVSFWQASTEVLAGAVPHGGAPCWYTLDPASLLVTSHYQQGLPELPGEWFAHEYYQDDVNKLVDVARSQRGSRRCMRPPGATRPAARAGTSTWPWAVTRS